MRIFRWLFRAFARRRRRAKIDLCFQILCLPEHVSADLPHLKNIAASIILDELGS